MAMPGGGFAQCYNAQAVVSEGSLLMVVASVVQAPNDRQQLSTMLDKLAELPGELDKPDLLLADNGYFSEAIIRPWLSVSPQRRPRWKIQH